MELIRKDGKAFFFVECTHAGGVNSSIGIDSLAEAYGVFLAHKELPAVISVILTLVFKKPDSKRIQLLMHYNPASLSDSPST